MPPYFYIGLEGPIAAGKTTLAGMLAENLGSHVLLEDFDRNEFLADFYADKERWGLGMQLWFLSSRREQLSTVHTPLDRSIVADYTHLKDRVFADFLLRDRELRLYDRLATGLKNSVPQPNLIVYLDARNDVLLKRIRKRDRPYEKVIDSSYQDSLRRVWERVLATGVARNVLRYDTTELDLNSEEHMNEFYSKIRIALSAALESKSA
jgi:deoxyguanosine kinase